MMIVNSNEFLAERKFFNKTVWSCSFKRYKCKARCVTYGRTLEMRHSEHNHETNFKGDYKNLCPQTLIIVHRKNKMNELLNK